MFPPTNLFVAWVLFYFLEQERATLPNLGCIDTCENRNPELNSLTLHREGGTLSPLGLRLTVCEGAMRYQSEITARSLGWSTA